MAFLIYLGYCSIYLGSSHASSSPVIRNSSLLWSIAAVVVNSCADLPIKGIEENILCKALEHLGKQVLVLRKEISWETPEEKCKPYLYLGLFSYHTTAPVSIRFKPSVTLNFLTSKSDAVFCIFLLDWALTRRGLIFSGSIFASFVREPFSIRSWMIFLRLQLCEDCRSHLSTLVSSLLCYAQKPLCHVILTLSPGSVLNQVKGF